MTQRSLFDMQAEREQYDHMPAPPARPESGEPKARARRSDPESSHAAAAEVNATGAARHQRERVIDLVYAHPGLSSNDLAKHCDDLDRFQIARRLPEAEELGEIHRLTEEGRQLRWYPGRKPTEVQNGNLPV